MAASWHIGAVQLGAYKLGERIATGRLAQVYRATDARGYPVAIKLLSPEAEMDDPAVRDRFHREIAMLAQVQHPNVLPLLGHAVDPELGPYLVTPLVEGVTLRELMSRGPVVPEVALLAVREIASGIAAMHAIGVVHRDIKPENVMVQRDGRVIVIDLGLAYRADQTRHTEEGAVAGSVPYMAPEQIEAAAISPATDVWALGVMLYEWIAGTRPFERKRPTEEVAAILGGRCTPVSKINRCATEAHDQLIGQCLTGPANQRIQSAAILAAHIDTLIDWPVGDVRQAFAAPDQYTGEVSAYRAAKLAEQAKQQLGAGQVFVATRLLERALAYRPNDPSLLSLIDHAARAPRITRSKWPIYVAIVLMLVGAAGVVTMLTSKRQSVSDEDSRASDDTPTALVDKPDRKTKPNATPETKPKTTPTKKRSAIGTNPVPPGAGALAPPSNWVKYTAPSGLFSVSMPVRPKSQSSKQSTIAGDIKIVQHMITHAGQTFGIAVTRMPQSAITGRIPNDILAGSRDGVLANIGGTATQDAAVFINTPKGKPIPGKQFVANTRVGGQANVRLFLHGQLLIQLLYLVKRPPAKLPTKEFMQFALSFRILKE